MRCSNKDQDDACGFTRMFFPRMNLCCHLPPESPLPCSRAAAATFPSAELQCIRHTSCNRRPAGHVWPSADPGQASRHQCQWKSHGWLGEKKKTQERQEEDFNLPMDQTTIECHWVYKTFKLLKAWRPPTKIHRGKSCQARHGISSLHLSPVSQQDVEDVVLGARSQGTFIHATTHQLTVVDHHDWECDKNWHH